MMPELNHNFFNARRWIHGVIVLPGKKILAERVIIAEGNEIPWNISVGIQTMRKLNNSLEDDIESLSTITERRFDFSLKDMKDKFDVHHIATHRPHGIGFLHQQNVIIDVYRIRLLSAITLKISKICEVRAFDFDYLVDSNDSEIKCDPRSREALNLFTGLKINL
jgi:hypothetical protein